MKYGIRDFYPLISLFTIIILYTLISHIIYNTSITCMMNNFMGAFFILFSALKIYNLHAFADSFCMYDLIAQRSKYYAYAYPFIELALGIAYLMALYPLATNITTIILMLASATSVAIELRQDRQITCACMGAVFNLPLSYVTLAENILMVAMATIMLIRHL